MAPFHPIRNFVISLCCSHCSHASFQLLGRSSSCTKETKGWMKEKGAGSLSRKDFAKFAIPLKTGRQHF